MFQEKLCQHFVYVWFDTLWYDKLAHLFVAFQATFSLLGGDKQLLNIFRSLEHLACVTNNQHQLRSTWTLALLNYNTILISEYGMVLVANIMRSAFHHGRLRGLSVGVTRNKLKVRYVT